jgi:hypothetical protein
LTPADTNEQTTGRALTREALVFVVFVALTVLMTWPWALGLRDAAADPGDSYLNAWIMWWDYHATFSDPLDLFHANIFYPYRYTLAFSEHNYGISLPFFPLYALGLRPLTVHGVATLLGFALCGYGAFRLGRTLTGSWGAGFVAGVVFAFIPFRFHHLPHVTYLFSGWVPLVLEALVLFARAQTRRRAAWLGVAFFMNALTCIHWFVLTLIPLALAGALLLYVHRRAVEWRRLAVRGGVALGAAGALLLPFLVPYLRVAKLYGFVRKPEEVAFFSATLSHWLTVDFQNKLWQGLGTKLTPYQTELALFPGLLPVLLAAVAFVPLVARGKRLRFGWRRGLAVLLEAIALGAGAVVMLTAVYGSYHFNLFGRELFSASSPERAFALCALAFALRCLIARPGLLRGRFKPSTGVMSVGAGLVPARGSDELNVESVETLRAGTSPAPTVLPRSPSSADAFNRAEVFGVAAVWVVVGFLGSFGTNLFFHRALYEYVPLFRSTRVPARWALIAYVGLAVLAGVGVQRLARGFARLTRRQRAAAVVYALAVVLLLFEQRAAPLVLLRGAADPDALTLRIKSLPMRGGLVELPTGVGSQNYLYVLRAADHARPLVNGVSGFMTPLGAQLEAQSKARPINAGLLDLLESIPASYLTIHYAAMGGESRDAYENFLRRGVAEGRLRLVGVYGEGTKRKELYAVTKTEPEAQGDPAFFGNLAAREWATQLTADPVHLLGQYRHESETLYRMHLAATGRLPRYEELLADARAAGRGVVPGARDEQQRLEENLLAVAEEMTERPSFKETFDRLDDARYVERLYANAGFAPTTPTRDALTSDLSSGRATRAEILLKVTADPQFAERERHRSLVLLHFFAYLRRNPDDPPDRNTDGLLHWVIELERGLKPEDVTNAFAGSIEHERLRNQR